MFEARFVKPYCRILFPVDMSLKAVFTLLTKRENVANKVNLVGD